MRGGERIILEGVAVAPWWVIDIVGGAIVKTKGIHKGAKKKKRVEGGVLLREREQVQSPELGCVGNFLGWVPTPAGGEMAIVLVCRRCAAFALSPGAPVSTVDSGSATWRGHRKSSNKVVCRSVCAWGRKRLLGGVIDDGPLQKKGLFCRSCSCSPASFQKRWWGLCKMRRE